MTGVAQHGRVLLERAYGMADLERSVALTPTSILEARREAPVKWFRFTTSRVRNLKFERRS